MMLKILVLSIVNLVVISCWSAHEIRAEDYDPFGFPLSNPAQPALVDEYDRINSYLSRKVATDDSSANFKKANEWLGSLKLKSNLKGVLKKREKSHLEIALNQFLSLKDIVGNKMCSLESYHTLWNNNQGSRLYLNSLLIGNKQPRRIEKILHEYATIHATHCQKIYPKIFKEKIEEMSEIKLKFIDSFMNPFLETMLHHGSSSAQVFQNIVFNEPHFAIFGDDTARIAYEALRFSSGGTENPYFLTKPSSIRGGKVVDRAKIENYFTKFLLEPCGYYVRKLTPVFVPANFDLDVLENGQRMTESDEFNFAWFKFRLCNYISNSYIDNWLDLISNYAINHSPQ